ncbi:unnamed protein product, partial [Angiostrongylus costaricensis]|uniref:Beta-N-acetylhexosaminidase n=1 Tax=Angiostrongylus costaricensis TaxID=334426 RepID=A0A0R3PNY5_ANGCS
VLCLGDKKGVEVVKDALKQVIDVHKSFGIKYLHIGSDEAFEFGVCQQSVEWISRHAIGGDKQLLALSHMKDIALFVKELTEGTTVLAWHDMLKAFDFHLIADLKLGELIEPVIWDYSENIVTMTGVNRLRFLFFTDSAFSDLASNFPVVWASSAYKGANFPSAKYIDIQHYETNNLAWIDTKIVGFGSGAKVRKIPRHYYNRMAEIRSYGYNMRNITNGYAVDGIECTDCVDGSEKGCFTGFSVYLLFQGSAQQTISFINSELDKNHHLLGWMSPYSIRHNITQNWFVSALTSLIDEGFQMLIFKYLREIQSFIEGLLAQILPIDRDLRKELSNFFFTSTVEEFMFATVSPIIDRLRNYLNEAKRLSHIRVYPKRSLEL